MGAFRWVARFAVSASVLATLVPMAEGRALAANEDEKAGARAAAVQGQAAFDAKRWADALDLFTRAESLVHSPMHLLYKARSLVQLGQLVKAHETYLEITHEQSATPSPTLVKAKAAAQSEMPALEPRLANVTVKVEGPGAADATVTMDGAKVPPALIGFSRPMDPGEHKFQATGTGAQSSISVVTVAEGGTSSVTLRLEPVAAAAAAPSPSVPDDASPAPRSAPAAATTDTGVAGGGSGLRTVAYVAYGVGAVGLVVGTVFALTAKSKYKDANALCATDPCPLSPTDAARHEQLGKDGDSAKTLSLVGFIAGGAGVALGTTFLVLGSQKNDSAKAQVHPFIGLGSLGLSGKF